MKAKVDPEICTGCGLCIDMCPAIFQMEDGVAKSIADTVPSGEEETCREAADACPVEAISIDE